MDLISRASSHIAVVIPCYRVRSQILGVLAHVPFFVERIYVVDDRCPENSGQLVREECLDARVTVIVNPENLGVGGAVMAGYRQAISDGAKVIVKVDGDGQMDPALIPAFVDPILRGQADYTKGNRFFDLRYISRMPTIRLFGNAVLSFMTKVSTGYWNVFDPTNGYTAIHADVASHLPFDKISSRYFFETDILFRLGTFRAVVADVAMDARYGDEKSSLRISKILGEFTWKHLRNSFKRVIYNYYLRDVSLASLELPIGLIFLVSGSIVGLHRWIESYFYGHVATAGSVMLFGLQIIVGLQLLLSFIGYDIATIPVRVLHESLSPASERRPEMDNETEH